MRENAAELSDADWARLAELRAGFLDDAAPSNRVGQRRADWRSERDLELYDATFAQRIGWKWDAVLRELALRGVDLRAATLVDWGCGTGIAARKLASDPAYGVERVHLWDRSAAARAWARDRLAREHPRLEVRTDELPHDFAPELLLASHVLGELAPADVDALLALARRSRLVVWVEPGSHAVSKRLSRARDALLADHEVLAPCTHSSACGMLAPGFESNWCHHFARPPAEAFTSRLWTQFSQRLGIDLRSLPYAFVVLRKRESSSTGEDSSAPLRARVLGRPRIQKGRALLDSCDATGVRELSMLERVDRAYFRKLGDSAGELLIERWTLDGDRITGRA
jgi:hypothetical protein